MARQRPPRPSLRVVVTAGPTREHLDEVRFLSNASTGRMGWEIARAAAAAGAAVTLVLGPSELRPLPGVRRVDVVTTKDLLGATRAAVRGAHLVVFAAAPSDWRPARRRRGKPPREAGGFDLRLVPTEDVAARLGADKGDRVHVGFALQTRADLARARAKLTAKRFDAVVLDTPATFGVGGGPVWWVLPDGTVESLPTATKAATARAIWNRARRLLAARGPATAASRGAP